MFRTILEDRVAIRFQEPTKIQCVKELTKDSCEVVFLHKDEIVTFIVSLNDLRNFTEDGTTFYVRHWESLKVLCVSSKTEFSRMRIPLEGVCVLPSTGLGILFSFHRKPLPGGAALPKRPDRGEMYMLATKLQLEGYDI